MSGYPSFASGDFSGDGRADLVAVNTQSMRRFKGTGSTTQPFQGMTTVTTSPGPGGGIPVVVGRTVAVANTRLRLYDERCTTKPAGFPSNETFVAGGLCASVDLPGTATARHTVAATVGNRRFVLTFNSTTVGLYEITETTNGATVNAVQRFTATMTGIEQVAWSQADSVFIFASLNSLEARRLSMPTTTTASLTTVAGLGAFTVDLENLAYIQHITVGEFRPGQRSVVLTEQKSALLKVVPFSIATGWNRKGIVTTTFGGDVQPQRERSARIVVGQFNDDTEDGLTNNDDRLDIAILEKNSGNVIIVRQQPEPCISFITSSSHGHLAFPANYSPIARFNRRLAKEVAIANAIRRPASGFRDNIQPDNAAMCPARFVDVRGHWEEYSTQGTPLIVASRGSWLASTYLVWVPSILFTPVPSLPAHNPVEYWLSFGWLLAGDAAAISRLLGAGLSTGLEVFARIQASGASMRASRELSDRLGAAVTDASDSMNKCTGTIYVDLIGHSRGGPMITQALRRGFGARGDYNFEVSTTLLDTVDPSPGGSAYPWSNMRPWIRAGYIPGDPVITRVGSEWNSSFFGNDSSGEVPRDAFGVPLPNLEGFISMVPIANVSAEVFRAEVIGLPVGYQRSSILEHPARTFGSYQGPITPMQHKAFLGARLPTPITTEADTGIIWVNPDESADDDNNIRAPNSALANANRFTFTTSSHLGGFIADPRGFDTSTAVGFHTTTDFDDGDEARCFSVDGCNPAPGGCTDRVTAAAARNGERRDGEGIIVRELVPDFDFRISTGIVENAQTIVDNGPVKDQFPGDEFATLRSIIETTAAGSWVTEGTWRIDSGTVTLPATLGSADDLTMPFIAEPGVDYDNMTISESEAEVERWGDELEQLTEDGGLNDRVRTLADAAARTTDTSTDPWVQFTANAKISAELRAASIVADTFLVRVEFERSSTGAVSVGLQGPSLSGSASWSTGSTGRQVGQLIVKRSTMVNTGVDVVSLSAKNARVFSVSVRPAMPYEIGDNLYEFVSLELGVTQGTAQRLAARSRYNGYAGRLARVSTTIQLDKMKDLEPDVAGWIDGASETGAGGTFKDSIGASISGALFGAGTSFTAPRPRGADVYTAIDSTTALRLGHAHPGTNVDGNRVGFWIEYPGAGVSQSSTSPAEVGLLDRLIELFADAEADASNLNSESDGAGDEPAVTEDAVADCLSEDSLSCFTVF